MFSLPTSEKYGKKEVRMSTKMLIPYSRRRI